MKKAFALLLILATSITALSGCTSSGDPAETDGTTATTANPAGSDSVQPGETQPKTPEEVYSDILAHRENLHFLVSVETVESLVTVTLVQETYVDGDKIHNKSTVEMVGEVQTEENYYARTDTGVRYYFSDGGIWYDIPVTAEEFDGLLEFDNEGSDWMFSSEHYGEYDPVTHRYPLTDYSFGEDQELLGEDAGLQDGWLEIGDGSYTIHIAVKVVGQEMTSNIVISDFGKVKVELPASTPYTAPSGCSPESAPAPQEIADMIVRADSVSYDRTIYSDAGWIRLDGWIREEDRYSVFYGTDEEDVYWLLEKTDSGYDFYELRDEYELWRMREITDDEAERYFPVYDDLLALLKDEYYEEYDPETGLLAMKEGVSAEYGEYGAVSDVTILVTDHGEFGLFYEINFRAVVDGSECDIWMTVGGFDCSFVYMPAEYDTF